MGSAPATFINSGEINLKGLELEGKYKLSKHWEFIGNFSYQTNKNALGIEQVTYVPEKSLKLGVSHYRDRLNISLFNSYFGAATDPTLLNASTPAVNPDADAYNLLTAHLEYSLGNPHGIDGLSLTAYADNLLDEEIFFPSINRSGVNTLPAYGGRAFYLGLRFEL